MMGMHKVTGLRDHPLVIRDDYSYFFTDRVSKLVLTGRMFLEYRHDVRSEGMVDLSTIVGSIRGIFLTEKQELLIRVKMFDTPISDDANDELHDGHINACGSWKDDKYNLSSFVLLPMYVGEMVKSIGYYESARVGKNEIM